jgi:hypothetical protein
MYRWGNIIIPPVQISSYPATCPPGRFPKGFSCCLSGEVASGDGCCPLERLVSTATPTYCCQPGDIFKGTGCVKAPKPVVIFTSDLAVRLIALASSSTRRTTSSRYFSSLYRVIYIDLAPVQAL